MGPVTDTHRVMYRENFQLATQESKDQFSDSFTYIGTLSGKQVQVTDIIGTTEARVNAPEGGDTPDMDNGHEPVWVKPDRLDWGKILKVEDFIKATTDFKAPSIQSGVNAMMRSKNIIMASKLFGPRLIGNEVPVSTAWAGRTVALTVGSADGATNTGMNVKKILRAMRYMEDDDLDVDMEQLSLALDPQENEELYYDITFVSKDYRDKAVMEEKRVKSILGIPIKTTKRIANAAATSSCAALYCKSGMAWGPAMPLTVKSKENVNKQYREHPYAEMWFGATRTEDQRVVKILNYQP